MKGISLLIAILIIVPRLSAQNDTTKINTPNKNIVSVIDDEKGAHIKVGEKNSIEVITDNWGDTTKIRIGRRTYNIIEDNNGSHITVKKKEHEKQKKITFNGHWAGLEFGFNLFNNPNYDLYPFNPDFMELNHGKSTTINFNFSEIAFRNKANNFAFVTGLGISFMDFTFDNPLTITKANSGGIVIPVLLDPDGLKKTKLNVTYLTAPLLLEVKTPLRFKKSNLFIAAGIIGGFNIGAHTKYKYKKVKEKEKRNFNINPFKYELTGRIGLGDFYIFANYGMTPLFKNNKGPELFPVTFGISFPNN